MSADAIDEIQSKKRREKGLEAWAEMLQRLHQRGPAAAAVEETPSGGSSRLPTRDTLVLSDPKALQKRREKLQAVRAANEAAQAEARKLQDHIQLQLGKQVEATQRRAPTPAPSAAPATPAKSLRSAGDPPPTLSETPVPAAPENTKVAEEQKAVQEHSAAGTGERLELARQANVQPAAESRETVSFSAPEPELPAAQSAAEEAAMLAALRSGVGANPELAAKEYVLAAELPGVRDTLQGGIYEEFRVAL